MATTELKVEGMTCGGCENTLSKAVKSLEGVQDVSADHESGRVVVTHEDSGAGLEDIKGAIEFAGYDVVG